MSQVAIPKPPVTKAGKNKYGQERGLHSGMSGKPFGDDPSCHKMIFFQAGSAPNERPYPDNKFGQQGKCRSQGYNHCKTGQQTEQDSWNKV